jgi:large subunit ribosomal protein LX
MSEVRTFRITGEIKKPTGNINFSKEMKGLRKEQVVERLYAELGSKHKAKRFEITFTKITEEKPAPEKATKTRK